MKLRQITKRVSANCHIKNRPTATLKIGQLPHLLLKKWLNLKFNLYLCTKIVKNMEYKKKPITGPGPSDRFPIKR